MEESTLGTVRYCQKHTFGKVFKIDQTAGIQAPKLPALAEQYVKCAP